LTILPTEKIYPYLIKMLLTVNDGDSEFDLAYRQFIGAVDLGIPTERIRYTYG